MKKDKETKIKKGSLLKRYLDAEAATKKVSIMQSSGAALPHAIGATGLAFTAAASGMQKTKQSQLFKQVKPVDLIENNLPFITKSEDKEQATGPKNSEQHAILYRATRKSNV